MITGASAHRTTVRTLAVDRQIVVCEGVTRKIVRIPDYQVKLMPGGPWHRRGAIETETACGAPILPFAATMLRAYLLDTDICHDGCFSPREHQLGVAYAKELEARRGQALGLPEHLGGMPRERTGFDMSDVDSERDDDTRKR